MESPEKLKPGGGFSPSYEGSEGGRYFFQSTDPSKNNRDPEYSIRLLIVSNGTIRSGTNNKYKKICLPGKPDLVVYFDRMLKRKNILEETIIKIMLSF